MLACVGMCVFTFLYLFCDDFVFPQLSDSNLNVSIIVTHYSGSRQTFAPLFKGNSYVVMFLYHNLFSKNEQ